VVVEIDAEVKCGPGPDYTVEFVIHEGTEVMYGRASGGWTEVTVTRELKGWVLSRAIEPV
jgi:uncharacterized protein YraI